MMPTNLPNWAERLLGELRDLETQLGNVVPKGEWTAATLEELSSRLNPTTEGAAQARTETIFVELAQGLTREGLTASEIATVVNDRLSSEVQLPYCSATEVQAALA